MMNSDQIDNVTVESVNLSEQIFGDDSIVCMATYNQEIDAIWWPGELWQGWIAIDDWLRCDSGWQVIHGPVNPINFTYEEMSKPSASTQYGFTFFNSDRAVENPEWSGWRTQVRGDEVYQFLVERDKFMAEIEYNYSVERALELDCISTANHRKMLKLQHWLSRKSRKEKQAEALERYLQSIEIEKIWESLWEPPKRSVMLSTKLNAILNRFRLRTSVVKGLEYPSWYRKYVNLLNATKEAGVNIWEPELPPLPPALNTNIMGEGIEDFSNWRRQQIREYESAVRVARDPINGIPWVNNQMDIQDTPKGDPPVKDDIQAGSSVMPQQEIVEVATVPNEKIDLGQYIVPEELQVGGAWGRLYQLYLGERFSNKNCYTITADQTFGTKLGSIKIFSDILKSLRKARSPICETLDNYQYMRATVHLYFQMESTEMMAGSLMVVLKYMGDNSLTNKEKKNLYTLSQLPNIKLQMGAGGHGEMVVPFVYPYGMMIANEEIDDFMDLAVVEIYILNTLRGPTNTGCNAVTTKMQVSFKLEDVSLSGMIPRNIKPKTVKDIDNQSGLESIIPIASKVINFLAEGNRDKPRASCNRVPMVPQTVQNLSVGTGCADFANTMRLDNEAYIPQSDDDSEYSLEHLSRIKSLFKILQFSSNDAEGSFLNDLTRPGVRGPFAHGLLLNQQHYYKASDASTSGKTIAQYAIPACDIVASDKCYSRARIKYTFDVIATKFHAGQIGVAFLPGPIKSNIKLSDLEARNACYKILNIQKEKQMEFIVPYQAHSLVVPRQTVYTGDNDYFAMGHIYIWCVVPLMQTCTVSSEVDINVYKSCEDIELYLPAQPLLVPSWKIQYPVLPGTRAEPLRGYYPWGIDTWRFGNFNWLRYSDETDHVTQFNPLQQGGIYILTDANSVQLPTLTCNVLMAGSYMAVEDKQKYMVAVYDASGPYYYGIMFNASAFDGARRAAHLSAVHWGNFSDFCKAGIDEKTMKFMKAVKTYGTDLGRIDMLLHKIYTLGQIGDESITYFSGATPLDQHKRLNRVLFGENSVQIKDQCRRYVPYCELTRGLYTGVYQSQFIVPLNTTTLTEALREKVSSIELLHLPYLYAKGSFNLTIILSEYEPEQWVWFIWRPDSNVQKIKTVYGFSDPENFFSQGYSLQIMHPVVNPIMQINCPFGRMSNKVMLNHKFANPNIVQQQFLQFGSLLIGSNRQISKMEILYSIGDDFVGSTCLGFPNMGFIADFPKEPQSLGGVEILLEDDFEELSIREVDNQMFNPFSGVTNLFKPAVVSKVEETTDELKQTCSSLNAILKPELMEKFNEFIDAFQASVVNKCAELKAHLVLAFTHLTQILVTPTKEVATVGLAAIVGGIILQSKNVSASIFSYFSNLLSRLTSQDEHYGASEVDGQADLWDAFSDEQQAKLCGLLFAGVSSTFGVVAAPPKSWSEVCKHINTELPKNCKSAVGFMQFFTWVWDIIMVVFKYIKNAVRPEDDLERYLTKSDVGIRAWSREAYKFTDPIFFVNFKENPCLVDQVTVLLEFGRKLYDSLHKSDFTVPNISAMRMMVANLVEKLTQLRMRCKAEGIKNSKSVEAFVVWDFSPLSKLGKSHSVADLSAHMMRAVGKKFHQNSLYFVDPGMTQFDGCGDSEIAVFDDFLIIDSPDKTPETFSQFFSLTGPGRFKPLCATYEEKHTIWSPSLVQVCSNRGIFNASCLSHKDAFLRRRHILCEWDVAPKFQDCLDGCALNWERLKAKCSKEEIDDVAYLQFYICDRMSGERLKPEKPLTYKEYAEYRVNAFKQHVQEQSLLATKRMQLYTTLAIPYDAMQVMQTAVYKEVWGAMVEEEIADLNLFPKTVDNQMGKPHLKCFFVENQNSTPETTPDPTSESESSLSDDIEIIESTASSTHYRAVNEEYIKKIIATSCDVVGCESNECVKSHDIWIGSDSHGCEPYHPSVTAIIEANMSVRAKNVALDAMRKAVCPTNIIEVVDAGGQIPSSSSKAHAEELLALVSNNVKNMNAFAKTPDIDPDCCPHHLFTPTSYFHEETSEFWSKSYIVPDKPCEDDPKCRWLDEGKYSQDMLDWVKAQSKLGLKQSWRYGNPDYSPSPAFFRDRYTMEKKFDDYVAKFELTWFEKIRNFFVHSVPKAFKLVWQFIKKIKWWLTGLAVLLGVVAIGVTGAAMPLGQATLGASLMARVSDLHRNIRSTSADSNIVSSGDAKIMRAKLRQNHVAIKRVQEVSAQSGHTAPLPQTINNILRNTLYIELRYWNAEGVEMRSLQMRCFSPGGRTVVVPKHYLEWMVKKLEQYNDKELSDLQLTVVRYNVNSATFCKQLPITVQEIMHKAERLLGTTLWKFELPAMFDCFRNYVTLLPHAKDSSFHHSKGVLVEMAETLKLTTVDISLSEFRIRPDAACEAEYIESAYTYNYGGNGVCGSLLLSGNTIIGMHVAGQDKALGVSEPLVKEMFEDIKITAGPIISLEEASNSSLFIDTNIEELGVLPPNLISHDSGKTRIRPSLVQNQYSEVITEPAPLHSKDPRLKEERNVLLEGVRIHGLIPKSFDPYILDNVAQHYQQFLMSTVKPQRVEIGCLPMHEAIVGIPGMEGYKGMDFNTSEGYPFVYSRPPGKHNKEWLFSLNDDKSVCLGLHPLLSDVYGLNMAMRRRGLVPPTVFIDCKKDCRIPKEKIHKEACTRIFSTSPVDFTIATRQYFLDFSAAFQANRIKDGSAVGINVDSDEWTRLLSHLRGKERFTKFVAGDYSKFGPRLLPSVVEKAFQIMIEWYKVHGDDSEENAQIREILGREMTTAIHQCYDQLYRTYIGAPSGSPLTVIINDMVNHMYLRYVWVDLGCGTLKEFEEHVRLVTYGDDSIATVSDLKIDKFNVNTISTCLAKYDIKYTDAYKTADGTYRDYVNWDEVTFLKRKFKWCDEIDHYLAPLPEDVCLEIMNWVWDSSDMIESTKVNVEASVEMLFGHGREVYTKHRNGISAMWNKKGFSVPLYTRTWDELKSIYFPELDVSSALKVNVLK